MTRWWPLFTGANAGGGGFWRGSGATCDVLHRRQNFCTATPSSSSPSCLALASFCLDKLAAERKALPDSQVFFKHICYYLSRPLQTTPEVTPSRSRSYNGQQITILLPGAQHESGPFYGQIIKRNVHRHYKAIKHQLKSGKNSFRATGIAQT